MNRTSLDLHRETVDSVDNDRTEDKDGAEDDTDDNDVGEICLLSGLQQPVYGERQGNLCLFNYILGKERSASEKVRR